MKSAQGLLLVQQNYSDKGSESKEKNGEVIYGWSQTKIFQDRFSFVHDTNSRSDTMKPIVLNSNLMIPDIPYNIRIRLA